MVVYINTKSIYKIVRNIGLICMLFWYKHY